jgi:hypothetical protein
MSTRSIGGTRGAVALGGELRFVIDAPPTVGPVSRARWIDGAGSTLTTSRISALSAEVERTKFHLATRVRAFTRVQSRCGNGGGASTV